VLEKVEVDAEEEGGGSETESPEGHADADVEADLNANAEAEEVGPVVCGAGCSLSSLAVASFALSGQNNSGRTLG
jgi:hypothetical protein